LKAVNSPKLCPRFAKIRCGLRPGVIAGNDDDRNRGLGFPHVADRLQPVHIRHENINDQQIELTGMK